MENVDRNILLGLCRKLYRRHSGGGNLHIVLDDGNIENHNIQSCIDDAIKEKDKLSIEIEHLLLEMTETEREEFYEKSEYSL